MGAKTRTQFIRRLNRWRLRRSPLKVAFLLILWLITIVSEMRAGDLKNTGSIANTGTIKVKNAALGIPAINGGVYEYFGGDQSVPSLTYQDLKLTGTGTKQFTAGAASVNGTFTIASGVTGTTPASVVHLNGTFDEQGYLLGTIDKAVTLIGAAGTSTFGDIGATISWTGTAPGATTVTRVTGVTSTSADPAYAGKQSIQRYFDIGATFSSGLNGTLAYEYADIELNGQNEATLSLWRSVDGGLNWRKQGGLVDPALNAITKTGILSFSRWTASDAANPLGPSFLEFVAQNIGATSGNGQSGGINTALGSPFVVTVADGYGNVMANVPVTFAIASAPGGATGQNLSVTNAVTNASGQASTVLQLGNTAGAYTVTATSGALTGSPISFAATATGGAPPPPPPPPAPVATAMILATGNAQVDTVGRQLANSFVVTVLNQFGGPFAGATVNFAISARPLGDASATLSVSSVTTNAGGQASTRLTLGTKPGTYTVAATSASLPITTIQFNSSAVTGRAFALGAPTGNGQSQVVKTTLAQPLVATVVDVFGNPVQGDSVRFAITRAPSGASGQAITDTLVLTNAEGRAQTTLTLGDSAGVYEVSGTSGALQGSPLLFTATATPGVTPPAATAMVLMTGNGQIATVRSRLANPLAVTVLDQFGNPFAGATVTFTIASKPSGDTTAALTVLSATTNASGQAWTQFTLGSKAGSYTVIATSTALPGISVVFNAAANAGRASVLSMLSGNGQSQAVMTTLTVPFVVLVADSFGNPIQSDDVRFAITKAPAGATGQQLSSVQVSTDVNGRAQTLLALGHSIGVYEVSATSGTLQGSPITFTATATAVAAVATRLAQTSGNAQSGVAGTQLASPMVVTVLDQFGNPFAGATVTFTISGSPSGDMSAVLSIVTAVTDAGGRASTQLMLGTKAGTYTVTASSGSLTGSPITFTATATAVAAVATRLVQTSGNAQSGVVGTQLASPMVVTVLDQFGNPFAGATVTLTIDSIPNGAAGQSLNGQTTITVTTDSNGVASVKFTVGSQPGLYKVSASLNGTPGSAIIFYAAAVPPAGKPTIAYTAGDAQSAPIITQLSRPLVVTALTAAGAPLAGEMITFVADSLPVGAVGQLISPSTVTTDAAGRATVMVKVGSKVGTYRISAISDNLSGGPITFRVRATVGVAHALVYVSGDGQTKQVGTTLDSPFVVRMVDIGDNPVSGIAVQFTIDSIPSGATGQRLSVATMVTDVNGVASTLMTLGDGPGVYKVIGTLPGHTPIVYRAAAVTSTGAVRLAYTSGNGQAAAVSKQLATPLVVTVFNEFGSPVVGQTVKFAIDSLPEGTAGQTITPASVTTDASGRASAVVTLGSRIGTYRITATSAGLFGSPVEFRVRATAGAARTFVAVTGNGQTKPIATSLDSVLVVRVADEFQNPVQGALVVFSIDSTPGGATGQKLTVLNAITDNEGQASVLLTLGSKAGIYVVEASSQSLSGSSVRFMARATSAAAAAVLMTSGNDQSGGILTQLLAPFVVSVVDIGGNPVQGVSVQFAIDSIPNGASGQNLRVLSSTTDENGQVAAMLTLGNREGLYTVAATSKGLIVSSVRFMASATVQRGDVNNDRAVDIADLTSIIDHVLGRIRLVDNDSVRSDINRDGRLNIADVVALQKNILATAAPAASTEEDVLGSAWSAITLDNTWTSDTAKVQSEFLLTQGGVRFNVANSAPLKGFQLMVRFKNLVNLRGAVEVFQRALVDSFFVNVNGTELRIVAYNLTNKPIAAGDGTLFRLPMVLTSVDGIEISRVVFSMADSASIFDKAVPNIPTKHLVDVEDVPTNFVLYQNYPNPFNGTTKIEYEVSDGDGLGARALLQVFDVLGSKIKTLVSKSHYGGRYSVVWDGRDDAGRTVSSGTYYYRLISGDHVSGKKMLLLK